MNVPETIMRRKIIEALTYPRILMMSQMEASECPMHKYFNAESQVCLNCQQGKECLWLNSNDEFSVLTEQPIDILFDTFVFSIDYVETHVSREKHNFRRCICESCVWIKDARHTARQYKGHSATISS